MITFGDGAHDAMVGMVDGIPRDWVVSLLPKGAEPSAEYDAVIVAVDHEGVVYRPLAGRLFKYLDWSGVARVHIY